MIWTKVGDPVICSVESSENNNTELGIELIPGGCGPGIDKGKKTGEYLKQRCRDWCCNICLRQIKFVPKLQHMVPNMSSVECFTLFKFYLV